MFERYTESARRTLFYARYEARRVGGTSIDPEHVLLGMVKEPGPLVGRIFAAAEISHRAIWQELDAQKTVPKLPTSVEMPFSEDTKRVLQYAGDEASSLAHGHVAVAHLLLGLLRKRGTLAERYLATRGISIDRLREQIRLEEATPAADSTSGPTPSEALVALAGVSSLLDQIRQSCTADVAQLIEGIEVELQLVERALVRDK